MKHSDHIKERREILSIFTDDAQTLDDMLELTLDYAYTRFVKIATQAYQDRVKRRSENEDLETD